MVANPKSLRSPKPKHKSSTGKSYASMTNRVKKPMGQSFRSPLAKKTIKKDRIHWDRERIKPNLSQDFQIKVPKTVIIIEFYGK